MVLHNESITIMQKVEELKQWQKLHEAKRGLNETLDSVEQGNQRQNNEVFDVSSASIQPRARENLDVRDLDNGIHIIDELLNRIQRQSTDAPNSPCKPPYESNPGPHDKGPDRPDACKPGPWGQTTDGPYADPREDLADTADFQELSVPGEGFQEEHSHQRVHGHEAKSKEVLAEPLECGDEPLNRAAKPKRPFLKRGQGLSRYRMTLSDFKKPVPKPSFALGRKKSATRPVAVPDKRAAPTHLRQQPRPNVPTRAALNHLETWSNVFGDPTESTKHNGPPGSTRHNDQPADGNVLPRGRHVQSLGANTVQSVGSRNVQMSPLTQIRTQMSSELDRRKKKESEEQHVFDLLEQRTRDSSFNSTSTMVAKLMEDSVMSTPVKLNSSPLDYCDNSDGRVDKGLQVQFSQANLCRTIEEELDEDNSSNGFSIDPLPKHTEPECECGSESETQYYSSDEDPTDVPSVDEAIKSYRPVLNRPYVDSGRTGAVTYSQLEEYLRLSEPLRALPLNLQAKGKAPAVQTNNNNVVKETKQLLADIKKLADERQRDVETENKENERGRRKENERGKRQGGGFPKTVYQEAYRAANGKTAVAGLKSFGAGDPEPNPFEHKSESDLNLELLKKRLGDLENEIHVFRLENIRLNKERKEFEKDKAAFARTKKTNEKTFEDEKAAFMKEMEEEKNKLNKEKKVFLKYAREAKNLPSKQEREEMAKLRAELQGLKEEAVKKETKWAASQARLRNHIKVLETQNQELKIQVEKLGKEAKKVSFASKKHISNTQVMNAINSQISKLTKADVLPPPQSILKKPSTAQPPSPALPEPPTPHSNTHKEAPSSYNLSTSPTDKEPPMPEDSFDRVIYQSLYCGDRVNSGDSTRRESGDSRETPSRDDAVISIESLNLGPSATDYKEITSADGTKKKQFNDGRQEIVYPNGNTVIISEAGKYVKMFYYNGDIKETDTAENTVRYFYSETKTWHTTQPDGTEVLEFSNGQRETRHKDGRVEVEYSNGCRRTISQDGTELWQFDSGPVSTVETLRDGTRTLSLRNGQREIHTREFKRREFPDGSVKLVYPDGITETRYPNGRIRLKDGLGSLIMDSHEK